MSPRIRAVVALVLILDVLFVGWSFVVRQLEVVVVTNGPARLVLSDERRSQTLQSRPAARDLRVHVTSEGAAIVHPLLSGSGALLSDDTEYQVSGFSLEGALRSGGRWRSTGPTADLTWTGRVAGVTVPLVCGAGLGNACVEATPTLPRRCFELSTCQGSIEVAVPSPATVHTGLIPVWRTGITLESEAPVRVESVTVRFGPRILFERSRFDLASSEALGFDGWGLRAALFETTSGLAQLLLQLTIVLAVMVVAGLALTTFVAQHLGLLEALLLAFFVGQGLTANLTTTAFYLVPTTLGWPLVWTALALGAAVHLARGGWGAWRSALANLPPQERRHAALLIVVSTVSCLVVAFPAVVFPGWYVGQGYTDSVDYPSWASLAREAAIDRGLAAIRFQDFVRVAITAQTLGIDTRAALAPQMLVLWWVFPLVAWVTLKRLGLAAETSFVGALMAGHGFCLYEIATQCYLPHYEVAVFAAAGVWVTLWLTDARAEGSRGWAEVVAAAVFSAGVGLYPYHAFSVMAFALGTVLVVAARRRWELFASALRVGLFTALFCNANLEVVFDFGKGSMQHRASLNAIGRNVVFPWYESPSATSILAGTDDFVRNSTLEPALSAVVFSAMPRTGERFGAITRQVEALIPPVTAVLVVLSLGALVWVVVRRRDFGGLVGSLTMALPLLMAINLMRTGDVYFWVKSLMTFAAMAIIPVAGLTASLLAHPRRIVGGATAMFLMSFVLVSLRTAWFDQLAYAVPRESPVLTQTRTHLPVTGEPLWRLERFVRALPKPRRFVLVGELDDRYWTDGDWVTYNRVLQLLEGHDVTYGADEHKRYTRSREVGYRGQRALTEFDFVISFDSCEPPARATIALSTELFCIFELRAPTG